MARALFYSHFQGDPFFNMACDEWLLAEALTAPQVASLRLYSWKIGTITIGYNQNYDLALDHSSLGTTPVVRRITGGRALYHDPDELTYSIAVRIGDGALGRLSGSLSATSATIAQALTRFLGRLGIEAAYVRQSARENASPAFFHKAPCFASAAKYEVMTDGGKIVASAQKRVGEALLQHGSIKLHGLIQHPALKMDVPSRITPALELTAAQFSDYSELFRATMSDALGVSFDPAIQDTDNSELAQYVATVQKNPLGKRDIVKQSFGASSL